VCLSLADDFVSEHHLCSMLCSSHDYSREFYNSIIIGHRLCRYCKESCTDEGIPPDSWHRPVCPRKAEGKPSVTLREWYERKGETPPPSSSHAPASSNRAPTSRRRPTSRMANFKSRPPFRPGAKVSAILHQLHTFEATLNLDADTRSSF
jgi:hypothetical protein